MASRILRVGLTGGAASGKSAVARLLARYGAAVRDADAVVEELYAGGRGAAAVRSLFGEGVMAADGAVDRRALGRVVLADPAARSRLEAAVHPLLRQELAAWLGSVEGGAAAVAVVEAALLVETGAHREYDRLVVVVAPLPARRRRALAAGWHAWTFDGVLAAQADDASRAAVADYLIDNGGDAAALEAAVGRLWALLAEDAVAAAAGRPLPRRERPHTA